ncbi:hypothetical protein [Kribbella sp. NPDC051770]|uniref:hypothetical protein n=1 Tax=Kribbella sp. NPDC051770 TaxID=3155413 RepID=UPI003447686D
MSLGYPCKSFSIGLPTADEDQSLTALFQHVGRALAEHEPISMEDMLTIGFEAVLEPDGVTRGTFTIVFADNDEDLDEDLDAAASAGSAG